MTKWKGITFLVLNNINPVRIPCILFSTIAMRFIVSYRHKVILTPQVLLCHINTIYLSSPPVFSGVGQDITKAWYQRGNQKQCNGHKKKDQKRQTIVLKTLHQKPKYWLYAHQTIIERFFFYFLLCLSLITSRYALSYH
jgi:hypothetical protein